MIDSREFAKRLKTAREENGLSQKGLANKIELAPQTLSAYEKGKKLPTLENAVELAEKLGVSLDWLLGLPNDGQTVLNLADIVLIMDGIADFVDVDFCRVLTSYFRFNENSSNQSVVSMSFESQCLTNDQYCDSNGKINFNDEILLTDEVMVRIRNGSLADYYEKRNKMAILLLDGTISYDLYKEWETGALKNLRAIPVQKKSEKTAPDADASKTAQKS